VVAGGTLRVDRAVERSVYAAGGRITIDAPVRRNVRIVGGDLEIASGARVTGNVSAAGGDIRVRGPIGGYLLAGAGHVLIDAPVGGDVDVRAGHLELGPRAAISGTLRYASGDEIVRSPAAQVSGGVERVGPIEAAGEARHGHAFSVIWTAGLMLLAAVLAAGWPKWVERVQRTLAGRPGFSVLAGFVGLVCIPLFAVVLLATVVGIPLGLLALLAYPALLLVGYACVAVAGGRMALARWSPQRQPSRGWQAGAAALCMLLISLAGSVPFIGWLVAPAVMVLGIGSVLLSSRPAPPMAA
jgi:hypothetical protein